MDSMSSLSCWVETKMPILDKSSTNQVYLRTTAEVMKWSKTQQYVFFLGNGLQKYEGKWFEEIGHWCDLLKRGIMEEARWIRFLWVHSPLCLCEMFKALYYVSA